MEELGSTLSLAYCIPFAGMLLSIAICPLINGEWWEKFKGAAVVFWSLLFLVPFAIGNGFGTAVNHLLEVVLGDYISFIVLLFGLFCVSANICVTGRLSGSPRSNTIYLLIGTLLASCIGTTGASMLLIRRLIRANNWRKHKVQTMVFFIFLVSNIGGCLTPVGDPPLLMGFMHGVPFTWSLHLFIVFILNVAVLLTLYFIIDTKAYKKDLEEGLKPQNVKPKPLGVAGGHNFIFLILIVGAVILSGSLGQINKVFADGVRIDGEVVLSYASIIEMTIILVITYLSYKTTHRSVRSANNFSWSAIEEVAVLFIGIFITMIPALLILSARGSSLGITEDWQMFWATGALSSFLDNTPTYLVFFETAISLHATTDLVSNAVPIANSMLMAISCGAVFMGANTYIGNAPNFMVKSIAEENNIKMPSFFGYMAWSVCCLIPVFLIDTIIFFI